MSERSDIEQKWLERWEKAKAFEPDPDNRQSFYLTVAYPYPSGGMHIGHARTYTVPDVIARFKRMHGMNVLFPMAWHVTGTPIIGALKRLKEGEKKQLRVLKEVYSMTDEELSKINEPMDFARYFVDNHYRPSMRKLGYTIDWRRQFTTNDPQYNRFITWQYNSLHQKGLVKKGKHPVKYCPREKNPVTTHDLLEGEDADTQEFTLLKFKFGDSYIVAATLRPETMFGQTNMWVNPTIDYVRCQVGDEQWIISPECADKLRYQDKEIEVLGEISGKDLVGKHCMAPVIERDIIILPSTFPDPNIGTGLVTSVPSDAPYDWIALLDLQNDEKTCKTYGLDLEEVRAIETIPIIDIDGFGPEAAKDIVKKMGIQNQKDKIKLEEATKEIYKAGFHTGVMNKSCGEYSGMAVIRAKEKIKQKLLEGGKADIMLEFSEPVVCRCGSPVVIAKADSWFLAYDNEDWKEQVRGCIENLNTIPERTKQDYKNTVDWLRQWPCIRNFGLGTKLPFDEKFIIEPLSDSTIYMAYYTISHILSKLEPKSITADLLDYVFRGAIPMSQAISSSGLDEKTVDELKKSFDYWYPQNFRCSALELIPNHLTFMLYHHTALFNADKWPRGIATFGMGLLEGAKMSSSKGNVILVKDAVEKHGADVVRLYLMGNAEPWQDFDWREQQVESVKKRLTQFEKIISDSIEGFNRSEHEPLDDWIISKVNEAVRQTDECLEGFQTRKALQICFYEMFKDLTWYFRRAKPNTQLMREISSIWVRLMSPFTPFICEELWEKMGCEGFASNASYPTYEDGRANPDAIASEEYIRAVMEDIQNILQIMKSSPKTISLYVSPQWKADVYKSRKEGKTIKELMADESLRRYGKEVAKMMQVRDDQLPQKIMDESEEYDILLSASGFLAQEFNCEIQVNPPQDPENKKRFAQPMKPGIYMSN